MSNLCLKSFRIYLKVCSRQNPKTEPNFLSLVIAVTVRPYDFVTDFYFSIPQSHGAPLLQGMLAVQISS